MKTNLEMRELLYQTYKNNKAILAEQAKKYKKKLENVMVQAELKREGADLVYNSSTGLFTHQAGSGAWVTNQEKNSIKAITLQAAQFRNSRNIFAEQFSKDIVDLVSEQHQEKKSLLSSFLTKKLVASSQKTDDKFRAMLTKFESGKYKSVEEKLQGQMNKLKVKIKHKNLELEHLKNLDKELRERDNQNLTALIALLEQEVKTTDRAKYGQSSLISHLKETIENGGRVSLDAWSKKISQEYKQRITFEDIFSDKLCKESRVLLESRLDHNNLSKMRLKKDILCLVKQFCSLEAELNQHLEIRKQKSIADDSKKLTMK